jgi:hypothetical protein
MEKYLHYSFYCGDYLEFVGSKFTFGVFSDEPMDLEKVRSTNLSGDYFCPEHFHELSLAHLPRVANLKEEFSLVEGW